MNFYDENSTYEMLENYEDEMADVLYLKELYPTSFLILQEIIDEFCDKLEYMGSIMFDEYPDKERLRGIEAKVYEEAKKRYELKTNVEILADNWLKDIISVLLINEMMRRRSRRRTLRRGFC